MSKFIDSHKLNYHPCRVCDWMNGKQIFPIYVELSPVNHCNHRCIFCSFQFTGYEYKELDIDNLKKNIVDMGKHGVKALMLGGEGEPLLHKNSVDIIKTCKENGINVAITTNGGPMTKKFSEEALKYVTWVKVSIDAGNPEDHAHIHGTSNKDFDMILENIEDALEVKRRQGLKTEIGAQALLFDENMSSVEELAWRLSDLNGELNHFVIKPYTSHPYRKERDYEFTGDYSEMTFPDDLNVILRKATFDRLDIAREYVECHALDFWSYIASDGEVYSCSNFLGNKKYSYGNINNKLFSDIWKEKSTKDIDMKNCRAICRMDKVNVYLDKVKNMTENMYFI